jgi:L-threonylcarbamoyladenylate synthase
MALKALASGEVIVFPTDTIYGLGCVYNSEHAVKEIYKLKTREFDKPLAAYFSSIEMMERYVKDYSGYLEKICEEFLPGPITIITEKKKKIPDYVTSNTNTIGIRIPKHKFLLELIEELDCPIVGTSANISNLPSSKTAREAFKIFNSKISYIFEDDIGSSGIQSTVISLLGNELSLIREGAIPYSNIKNILSR